MAQLTPSLKEEIASIKDPVIKLRWQRFFAIPQDLQESLFGEPFADSVWSIISEKYDLPDSGVSKVAKIIGLIFLGEMPIKNFIAALRDELKIDVQKASAIAQDINTAIFQPVRESLMAVHGISDNNHANTPENPNDKIQMTNKYQITNNQETRYKVQNTPNEPPPVSLDELEKRDPNTRMHPNDTHNQETRDKRQETRSMPQTPRSPTPSATSGLRGASTIQDPRSATPAMYQVPAKNVVDLRKLAKKRYNKKRYNGFFSA